MSKNQKTRNELFKDLFCAISEEDILRYVKGKFYIGQNELPTKDVETILAEARAMSGMFLWKLLLRDAKWTANQIMFENSKCWEDMMFGKACLYITDILDKKVKNLTKMEYGKESKKNEKK